MSANGPDAAAVFHLSNLIVCAQYPPSGKKSDLLYVNYQELKIIFYNRVFVLSVNEKLINFR